MRKNYLLIAAIILLTAGCKKETTADTSIQSTADQSVQSVIGTGCYGNTWTDGGNFNGRVAPILVYDNKTYLFNNPDYSYISVFDGSNWTTKASAMPFLSLWVDFAFVIGNKGYMGYTFEHNRAYYEYDFDANTWTPKGTFPAPGREYESVFTIGNKAYLVGGYKPVSGNIIYKDTWEYNPATNSWTQKASLPGLTMGRTNATGFSIGNKGYIVCGDHWLPNDHNYFKSLLEYDPSSNTWTYKANFPGEARADCKTFVIGGSAYAGGGYSDNTGEYIYYKDFYKYDPSTDTWTQIPLIPGLGTLRYSFSINSKGYVAYAYLDDFENMKLEKYTPLTCGIGNPGPQ